MFCNLFAHRMNEVASNRADDDPSRLRKKRFRNLHKQYYIPYTNKTQEETVESQNTMTKVPKQDEVVFLGNFNGNITTAASLHKQDATLK